MNKEIKDENDHIFNIEFLRKIKGGITIFPAGGDGVACYELLKDNFIDICCFIDNNSEKQGLTINSKPIISLEEFKIGYKNSHIVLSSRRYEKELVAQLSRIGVTEYSCFDADIYADTVITGFEECARLYSMLSDNLSRKTFLSIINFRVTNDSKFLSDIIQPLSNQYFEPTLYTLCQKDFFVDCGAYDGDTLELLMSNTGGKIAGYYGFEPNEHNFKILQRRAVKYSNLEIIKKGVFKENTTLSFNVPYDSISSSSAILDSGNETIEVVSLDNALEGKKVTFVKMDIEGAEMDALFGAKKIIQAQKPTLAISVYHKFDDFWKIPSLVDSFGVGYRYFLRHYTLDSSETILYAVV